MNQRPEILAVIPARGGSKSIPGKNVKLLGSHPLIAYSIAAARQSARITRTIVSTDDAAIAAVARQYGAVVPFTRPAALAGDLVTDLPVFEHALKYLADNEDYHPDLVVQLRPTSPFRPIGSVDRAIDLLLQSPGADSVRSVTPSGQNPFKMWLIEQGRLKPLVPSELKEPYNMPRQELPATFWQTGHIEVIRRETIVEQHSLTGQVILPLEIDGQYAIDLDDLHQWQYAEYIMQQQRFTFVQPNTTAAQ
jgi:N-acylneuraminate cytidylyltransferase